MQQLGVRFYDAEAETSVACGFQFPSPPSRPTPTKPVRPDGQTTLMQLRRSQTSPTTPRLPSLTQSSQPGSPRIAKGQHLPECPSVLEWIAPDSPRKLRGRQQRIKPREKPASLPLLDTIVTKQREQVSTVEVNTSSDASPPCPEMPAPTKQATPSLNSHRRYRSEPPQKRGDDPEDTAEVETPKISARRVLRTKYCEAAKEVHAQSREHSRAPHPFQRRCQALPNIRHALKQILGDAALDDLFVNGSEDDMEEYIKALRRTVSLSSLVKAEALQLERQVQEQNLHGVEALAFVLSKKIGTLEEAFAWLDFTDTNRFTRVAFETALVLLHIDVESLTGMRRQDIFSNMDAHHTSTVSWRDWVAYFGVLPDSELKTFIYSSSDCLSRTKVCEHAADVIGSHGKRMEKQNTGCDKSLSADTVPESRGKYLKKSESDIEMALLAKNRSASRSTSRSRKSRKQECAALSSRHRHPRENQSDTQFCEAGPMSSSVHSRQEHHVSLGTHVEEDFRSGCPRPEKGKQTEPLHGFCELVSKELSVLPPDGYHVFEGLKREERTIIAKIIRELGFWSSHEGSSVMVFRLSERASHLQERLEALEPGEGFDLEDTLEDLQEFSSRLVQRLGVWVRSLHDNVDKNYDYGVFRMSGVLSEFKRGVRTTLSSLITGEIRRFPAQLTKERQHAIEEVAAELQLSCARIGHGKQLQLYVGNLCVFAQQLHEQLNALHGGESVAFSPDLRPLEHQLVFSKAKELNLQFDASANDGSVIVKCMATLPDSAGAEPMYRGGKEDLYRQIFEKYAHQRSALPKAGLARLVQDLKRVREATKANHRGTLAKLESFFDDTLELQRDLGSRCNRGLTLQYFKVFLDKAAHSLGWFSGGVFNSLVDRMQECEESSDEACDELS